MDAIYISKWSFAPERTGKSIYDNAAELEVVDVSTPLYIELPVMRRCHVLRGDRVHAPVINWPESTRFFGIEEPGR
jgi:hypothetical protein